MKRFLIGLLAALMLTGALGTSLAGAAASRRPDTTRVDCHTPQAGFFIGDPHMGRKYLVVHGHILCDHRPHNNDIHVQMFLQEYDFQRAAWREIAATKRYNGLDRHLSRFVPFHDYRCPLTSGHTRWRSAFSVEGHSSLPPHRFGSGYFCSDSINIHNGDKCMVVHAARHRAHINPDRTHPCSAPHLHGPPGS